MVAKILGSGKSLCFIFERNPFYTSTCQIRVIPQINSELEINLITLVCFIIAKVEIISIVECFSITCGFINRYRRIITNPFNNVESIDCFFEIYTSQHKVTFHPTMSSSNIEWSMHTLRQRYWGDRVGFDFKLYDFLHTYDAGASKLLTATVMKDADWHWHICFQQIRSFFNDTKFMGIYFIHALIRLWFVSSVANPC